MEVQLTLWNLLERIEDPRDPSGKRYTLGSILKLMVSGLLCGCNNTAEILRWAKMLTAKHLNIMGFIKRGRLPAASTLSDLFKVMNIKEMEKTLGEWNCKNIERNGELLHVAIDGKSLRGSRHNETPAVHLLSAFSTQFKSVIGELKQETGDNEITTALELLKDIPLEGALVTGDAIFAQKKYVRGL